MEDLSGSNLKGYELQERLGAGGFGAVYRATQSTVGREVAIKIILPGHANQPEFIRRFETEAHLIARLEHHHIVPLYDYWRDPNGAYLVMRWLRGGSLFDLIRTNGALTIEDAVTIIGQLSQALQTAHRSQVIHRDIKPGNILMDEDGNAFLADFGIAKDHTVANDITNADNIVGSPDYLSPEQARSEVVTPQTDIYSLGVVLYEMLEGQHPFPNLSPVERLFKHLNEPLPDLETPNDDIRDELNEVVRKATAKDPMQRFKDVMEMAQALRDAAQMDGSQAGLTLVELLTPREQEVLKLIIDGKSNREIAGQLVLTVPTIKSYVNRIYKKLNVRSRVQAIVKARDLNLIGGKTTDDDSSVSWSSLPEPDNPYKGLQAFQAGDVNDFYGRTKLITKLISRMQEDKQYNRFLSIVGPSGSGKSSVTRAGLVPALWRGELPGSDKWYIVDLLPGNHPLDELEIALLKVAGNANLNLRDQLERNERGLTRAASLVLPDDDSELLIVIDQFEEVFTLVENEDDRKHFLDILRHAVTDNRSRVRIVTTLRADYYDRPLQYPEFGELMRSRVETILPLSADELEQAIRIPAENVGVQFEAGLVSKIVGDVHYQPGALPLLQFALTELFERRDGRTMTLQAYTDIGGTGGALAKRADEIFLEGDEAGQAMVRQMFLRLVTLGEGAEDTRRRVERAELLAITDDTELMDEVIDIYARSRLLSLDHDPSTRRPTVEVAHEAILREWERLRQWLNDSRDDIKQERQIAQAAEAWKTHNKDKSYLLTGSRLTEAETWQHETELALTALENDYIAASIQRRKDEHEAETQRQAHEARLERQAFNRLRIAAGIFAGATVIAAILAFLAFNASNVAADERDNAVLAERESLSVALAISAQQAKANDEHDLALALAIEANAMVEEPLPEVLRTLVDIAYSPGLRSVWLESGTDGYNPIIASAVSPDGRYLVTGEGGRQIDIDGLIPALILWDVATGKEIMRFGTEETRHTSTIFAAKFTPDSRYVISTGATNEAFRWDVETGEVVNQYKLADEGYYGTNLDFSPDGKTMLAQVCTVGTAMTGCQGEWEIQHWDVETGDLLNTFPDSGSITFSSDNESFYARENLDGDYFIFKRDLVTGEDSFRYQTDFLGASTIALSSDGKLLVYGNRSNHIYAIDALTGEFLYEFTSQDFDNTITSLSFSPDGKTLISGSTDSVLRVWHVETGEETERFRVGASRIQQVAFTAEGERAVTITRNGGIMEYDIMPGNHHASYTITETDALWDVLPLPDGKHAVLSIGTDIGENMSTWNIQDNVYLVLFDLETGQDVWRTKVESGDIGQVAVSPDGRFLLSTSRDFKVPVLMWDLQTGEVIRQFGDTGSLDNPGLANFSPDGQYVLISENGVIKALDIETGITVRNFIHAGIIGEINFSLDGRLMVTADWSSSSGLGMAKVWNFETGELLQVFSSHNGGVVQADFLPDNKHVISGAFDGTLRIWSIETGEEIRRIEGVGLGRTWGRLNNEHNLALFSDEQDNLVLLDVESGNELAVFAAQSTSTDASFSTDSQIVIAGGFDGVLHIWDVPPTSGAEILTWIAENRLTRELTEEECVKFRICEDNLQILSEQSDGLPLIDVNAPTATPVYHIDSAKQAILGEQRGEVPASQLIECGRGFPCWDPSGIDVWQYAGQAGEQLLIDVIADNPYSQDGISNAIQFQKLWPMIRVYNPDGSLLATTLFDSTGGSLDLTNWDNYLIWEPEVRGVELPSDGIYRIEVSGFYYLSSGEYTLVIDPYEPPPTAILGEQRGELVIGKTGRWHYQGQENDVITIRIEPDNPAIMSDWEGLAFNEILDLIKANNELPPLVTIIDENGEVVTQYNSGDSPDGYTNVVIEDLTLPANGFIEIEINTYANRFGGEYTLIVETDREQ